MLHHKFLRFPVHIKISRIHSRIHSKTYNNDTLGGEDLKDGLEIDISGKEAQNNIVLPAAAVLDAGDDEPISLNIIMPSLLDDSDDEPISLNSDYEQQGNQ